LRRNPVDIVGEVATTILFRDNIVKETSIRRFGETEHLCKLFVIPITREVAFERGQLLGLSLSFLAGATLSLFLQIFGLLVHSINLGLVPCEVLLTLLELSNTLIVLALLYSEVKELVCVVSVAISAGGSHCSKQCNCESKFHFQ